MNAGDLACAAIGTCLRTFLELVSETLCSSDPITHTRDLAARLDAQDRKTCGCVCADHCCACMHMIVESV